MSDGKHALVPGSFDPMTLGHRDLIRRVANAYDRVTVAVMVNRDKQYLFDLPTRVRICEASLASIPNVSVIGDDGMLIDLFDRVGADVVCKGYRNGEDLAYEQLQDDWNRAHNPRFRTVLFRSEGEHQTVSSTDVRSLLESGRSPEGLVSPEAISLIRAAWETKQSAGEADGKIGKTDGKGEPG